MRTHHHIQTVPHVPLETLIAWWHAADWDNLFPHVRYLIERIAYTQHVDWDDMDDVVAIVAMRCVNVRTVPDHPPYFIACVTRNYLRDTHKSGWRHKESSARADDALEMAADNTCDALTTLVKTDDAIALRHAIRTLPDLVRRAFVLRTFHNREYEDLATQFETTVGAMKMRVVRARRYLRRHYGQLDV